MGYVDVRRVWSSESWEISSERWAWRVINLEACLEWREARGQTDRGYKNPEPDISTLLFVSFNWNRIFQIAIRLGIKRIRIIRLIPKRIPIRFKRNRN